MQASQVERLPGGFWKITMERFLKFLIGHLAQKLQKII